MTEALDPGDVLRHPDDAYQDGMAEGWGEGVDHALAVLYRVLEHDVEIEERTARAIRREVEKRVTRTRVESASMIARPGGDRL